MTTKHKHKKHRERNCQSRILTRASRWICGGRSFSTTIYFFVSAVAACRKSWRKVKAKIKIEARRAMSRHKDKEEQQWETIHRSSNRGRLRPTSWERSMSDPEKQI